MDVHERTKPNEFQNDIDKCFTLISSARERNGRLFLPHPRDEIST